MREKLLPALVGMLLFAGGLGQAQAVIWTTPIAGGEMLFNDWNYFGPSGRQANNFSPIGVFDGASQIQRVVTVVSDGVTPDLPHTFWEDLKTPGGSIAPMYPDAFMDTMTNFYGWGYTSPAGSTFSNMQIDPDGDYLIKREDMAFNYYGTIDYTNMDPVGNGAPTPDGSYPTNIGFQPYALSDAQGWCGSVMVPHPASLDPMAGQVTFDFGFEAFLPFHASHDPGVGSMQIVKGFQMRSYGTLEVITNKVDGGQGDFLYMADAVVNNTDPGTVPTTGAGMVWEQVYNMDGTMAMEADGVTPRLIEVEDKAVGAGGSDASQYNEVSFMGGGIVPRYVWILMKTGTAGSQLDDSADNILLVLNEETVATAPPPSIPIDPDTDLPMVGDLKLHQNSFAGYPFLLRADGIRIVEGLNFSLYPDPGGLPAGALDGVIDLSPPVADPNGPYTGVAGVAVVFDGSGSVDPSGETIAQYDWDFGDGNTGTGVDPSHTYAAPGTYTITLTVTDVEGAPSAPASTTATVAQDSDLDGISDALDNCTLISNVDQRDTDADDYGNICDPDFNNNGVVNAADLAYMKTNFFTADPDADLDGSGIVNAGDLAILKTMFFAPPGPSWVDIGASESSSASTSSQGVDNVFEAKFK